ncbi:MULTISPECIES: DUF6318 family protein [Rothia]|uniref:DUF6318 family protein n=1 Tax=Rothia TaxID=32207 RepID=UPI000660C2A4|nr:MULTISPECIES: DUF6318 family protein [Rothia]OFO75315.1 Tat (twin-arginine translocation) pathway signal sequence [Rothia sp. HMSC065D02]
MLTTSVSRRGALGILGLGSAAFLAACSSSNSNGNGGDSGTSASSTSTRSDYSGEAKIDKFDTSAGTYEPATRETPAKNVPKPIKPENMNENSVAGLYSSIAFIGAALQYALQTGDVSLIKESAMSDEDKETTLSSSLFTAIQNEKNWLADPKLVMNFVDAQPKEENGTYTWPVNVSMSQGEYAVHDGETVDLPEDRRKYTQKINFTGKYDNNKWSVGGFYGTGGSDSSASHDTQDS